MNRKAAIELPSNRKFGLFMGSLCAAFAVWCVLTQQPLGAALAGCAAVGLFALAALAPRLLAPLNKAWMLLGLALGTIVSPIVLAILFFGLFTPVALVLRLLGRDELRLRRAAANETYWRMRTNAGFYPASFLRQY